MPSNVPAHTRRTRRKVPFQKKIARGYSSDELKRLAEAAYEERPPNGWTKKGFSCSTCVWFRRPGFCVNPSVMTAVMPNGCCAYWKGSTSFSAPKIAKKEGLLG